MTGAAIAYLLEFLYSRLIGAIFVLDVTY